MALRAGHRVVPIPGPSAPVALLSACGLVEGPFHFEGFLPARTGARDARLAVLARMPHPFVLFEAPHRIARTVPAIASACGPGRWIALGRELTKRFEEIHVCRAGEAVDWLAADPNRERGEYVLVVAAPDYDPQRHDTGATCSDSGCAEPSDDDPGAASGGADVRTVTIEASTLLAALLEALPLSHAVRVAQRASGLPHRELYQMALALKRPEPQ
jgi:16S rRNA (cytidine1402-2'-O)-methyltransferase